MPTERRDEAGRKVSDLDRAVDWVFHDLVPKLEAEQEAEQAEADVRDGVVVRLVPAPPPARKLRIGDVANDVFPDADE